MAGVEVILAALAAGAGAGSGDAAKAAVADAYTGLRDLLRRKLGGRPVLEGELIAAGADRDEEVLAAARRVLEAAARYDLREAKGVQIGDHNTQHNTFG